MFRECSLLFLCDAVAAHAFARIVDLAHDILRHDVACADDTHADSEGRPIPAKPSPSGFQHGSVWQGERLDVRGVGLFLDEKVKYDMEYGRGEWREWIRRIEV